jgi:glycosyltransferase involved in cell wall biosynthesis
LINRKNLNKYFIFLESCTELQMKYLYNHATLLFYPSLYEGFGMPVAEALLCDCPVIASSTSSIPEAGGTAALYCAPDDVDAAMDAYRTITANSDWKKEFIERARTEVQRFDRSLLAGQWNTLYASL